MIMIIKLSNNWFINLRMGYSGAQVTLHTTIKEFLSHQSLIIQMRTTKSLAIMTFALSVFATAARSDDTVVNG